MDERSELVAKALYEAAQLENGNLSALPWSMVAEGETASRWRNYARAAIAALTPSEQPQAKKALKIVPAKPVVFEDDTPSEQGSVVRLREALEDQAKLVRALRFERLDHLVPLAMRVSEALAKIDALSIGGFERN